MKNILLNVFAFAALILIPSFNFAQAPELAANTGSSRAVNALQEGIDVYPNPTNGFITVSFNDTCKGTCSDKYVMNVMDITGKLVFSTTLVAIAGLNLYEIDLSKEGKGIYLLKIKNDDIKEQKKIIIL